MQLMEGVVTRLAAHGLHVVALDAGWLKAVKAKRAMLLDVLADSLPPCDLVLAEGWEDTVHDKVLTPPPANGSVSPGRMEGVRLAVAPQDGEAAAQWVLSWLARRRLMRQDLAGTVLTGGASRRMGTDKSGMRIGGQSVLARLCELLADRLGDVMIVGRKREQPGIPRCIEQHADVRMDMGPLGGVYTALQLAADDGEATGVCAIACDMPAVNGRILDRLLTGRNRGACVTAPINPATGRLEPLLTVYEASALPHIEEALNCGRLAIGRWLYEVDAHPLPVAAELAGCFTNVNTPSELAAFSGAASLVEAKAFCES